MALGLTGSINDLAGTRSMCVSVWEAGGGGRGAGREAHEALQRSRQDLGCGRGLEGAGRSPDGEEALRRGAGL